MVADERFRASFLHLLVLAGGTVVIQYVLGFALALALAVWRQVRGGRLLRVVFLIPMMTTPVVMAAIWQTMFNESLGPVNDLLGAVGVGPVGWLTSAGPAYVTVMSLEIWQWTPFMFLLLLAGLLSLPREPFMAAAIDGAGAARTFFKVTFPLMAPVTVTALIIRLIESSKMSDTIFVLTSGYYLYIRGLREQQTGYAGALSVTYLVLMIVALTVLSIVLVRFLRTREG